VTKCARANIVTDHNYRKVNIWKYDKKFFIIFEIHYYYRTELKTIQKKVIMLEEEKSNFLILHEQLVTRDEMNKGGEFYEKVERKFY